VKKGEALSGLGTNVARREDLLKDFCPAPNRWIRIVCPKSRSSGKRSLSIRRR